MKISLGKPRRAATGAELAGMLLTMDREVKRNFKPKHRRPRPGNGKPSSYQPGKQNSQPVSSALEETRCKALALECERDESGALPAGHKVSWGALWAEADPPAYHEVCAYGAAHPVI